MSNPAGNPNIAAHGEATQFGKGQDPTEIGSRAAPWSIRNMVRYFAAHDIDVGDVGAMERFLGKKPTVAQLVAMKGLEKAVKGDMAAIGYATEQIDGKLPQRNELTGADGGPIDVNSSSEAREFVRSKLLSAAPDGTEGETSGGADGQPNESPSI